jgi:hypothetical protein
MLPVDALKTGDVICGDYDDGVGGTIAYRRIVAVTPKSVVLEMKNGERYRRMKSTLTRYYDQVCKAGEWTPWNPEGS